MTLPHNGFEHVFPFFWGLWSNFNNNRHGLDFHWVHALLSLHFKLPEANLRWEQLWVSWFQRGVWGQGPGRWNTEKSQAWWSFEWPFGPENLIGWIWNQVWRGCLQLQRFVSWIFQQKVRWDWDENLPNFAHRKSPSSRGFESPDGSKTFAIQICISLFSPLPGEMIQFQMG